ncbi:MAG: lactate utilization protein C [Betaproteobacteria bacterium]|nr:lactate utilization protein C [Betaproteobacteria bacterium]
MSARDRILARIRAQRGEAGPTPEADLQAVRVAIQTHERGPQPGFALHEPISHFIEQCARLKTSVAEVAAMQDVPREICRYLAANGLLMTLPIENTPHQQPLSPPPLEKGDGGGFPGGYHMASVENPPYPPLGKGGADSGGLRDSSTAPLADEVRQLLQPPPPLGKGGADRLGDTSTAPLGKGGADRGDRGDVSAASSRARLCGWPAFSGLDWVDAGLEFATRPADRFDGVGLTGCFCAIGETGTLVLLGGPETPKVTALLPETHICVVPRSRIVATMEDAFQLLRDEVGEPPRSTFLVSGPSRTADIEQTIVIGAHGPYRVHVILVP